MAGWVSLSCTVKNSGKRVNRKIASEKENEAAHKKNARNEELERERAQLAEEALRANMLEGKPADNDFDLFTADGPIDTDKDKEEKDN